MRRSAVPGERSFSAAGKATRLLTPSKARSVPSVQRSHSRSPSPSGNGAGQGQTEDVVCGGEMALCKPPFNSLRLRLAVGFSSKPY